jgi:hypothetical protein
MSPQDWEGRDLPEEMVLVDGADAASDAAFAVRVRRDASAGSAVRGGQWIWQLSVESDRPRAGDEAFVASFLSWVDAVEALHRAAEQLERRDDRSTPETTPADVADALSVRERPP